ncbi:Ff.00g033060.m01.CDS01 [Fusarium sp. VM40]|nr:Ff.00g033060.m01.CDS01 [Fusarium sp. VM40]
MGGGPINPVLNSLSGKSLTLRRATKDDLDDITWIVRDGSPDDPGTDYRFPYRDKYPADFWKWSKVECEEYFDRPDKLVVLVVTAPILDDGQIIHQPISFGVWDIAVTSDFIPGDHGIHERRDANATHMRAYLHDLSDGIKKNFRQFGKEQIALGRLVTHPDFRRRGAATMICEWGQREASKDGKSLSLLATPMGKPLYLSLGYNIIGKVVVQVDGEEERLEVDAMVKHN